MQASDAKEFRGDWEVGANASMTSPAAHQGGDCSRHNKGHGYSQEPPAEDTPSRSTPGKHCQRDDTANPGNVRHRQCIAPCRQQEQHDRGEQRKKIAVPFLYFLGSFACVLGLLSDSGTFGASSAGTSLTLKSA